MARRIRAALIGAGGMANRYHYPSLATFPDLELAAICDLVPEKARGTAERFGIPRVDTDYRRMLAEVDPEAVWVLMPPQHLYEPVSTALQQGRHVFIEKPLALTTVQARMLAYFAEQRGLQTMVGFQRRHIPAVTDLRRRVEERGPIHYATVSFLKATRDLSAHAGFYDGAIDPLTSDGIHAVDNLRWLCGGEVVDVHAGRPPALHPRPHPQRVHRPDHLLQRRRGRPAVQLRHRAAHLPGRVPRAQRHGLRGRRRGQLACRRRRRPRRVAPPETGGRRAGPRGPAPSTGSASGTRTATSWTACRRGACRRATSGTPSSRWSWWSASCAGSERGDSGDTQAPQEPQAPEDVDWHCHSPWSDGQGTLAGLARRARCARGPAGDQRPRPGRQPAPAHPRAARRRTASDVRRHGLYAGVEISAGDLEWDVDLDAFDYVIASLHTVRLPDGHGQRRALPELAGRDLPQLHPHPRPRHPRGLLRRLARRPGGHRPAVAGDHPGALHPAPGARRRQRALRPGGRPPAGRAGQAPGWTRRSPSACATGSPSS